MTTACKAVAQKLDLIRTLLIEAQAELDAVEFDDVPWDCAALDPPLAGARVDAVKAVTKRAEVMYAELEGLEDALVDLTGKARELYDTQNSLLASLQTHLGSLEMCTQVAARTTVDVFAMLPDELVTKILEGLWDRRIRCVCKRFNALYRVPCYNPWKRFTPIECKAPPPVDQRMLVAPPNADESPIPITLMDGTEYVLHNKWVVYDGKIVLIDGDGLAYVVAGSSLLSVVTDFGRSARILHKDTLISINAVGLIPETDEIVECFENAGDTRAVRLVDRHGLSTRAWTATIPAYIVPYMVATTKWLAISCDTSHGNHLVKICTNTGKTIATKKENISCVVGIIDDTILSANHVYRGPNDRALYLHFDQKIVYNGQPDEYVVLKDGTVCHKTSSKWHIMKQF